MSGSLRGPKEVDEDFQRGPYLTAAWVIKVEAFERRWSPVVEHCDKPTIGKHWRKIYTRKLHQAESIRYGPNCQRAVIGHQRAVDLSLEASPLVGEPSR